MRARPFHTLWRAFLAQFFTSESVTSDVQLRQSMVGVLAFILTPCLLILISIFPQYQYLVIRVSRLHMPPGAIVRATAVRNAMAEDMLEWIVAVLVGYSMITIGLIAVFAWDALAFDRRDAMVFGPLPLRPRTIIAAKLAALTTLLLGSALAVNLLNTAVFAVETSDRLGAGALLGHFAGCLTVTTAAATLVFATIVALRSTLAVVGGPRLTSAIGSLLQFGFVVALLGLLIATVAPPARRGIIPMADTNSPPIAWFVALFEVLRRSDRGSWPEFVALARPAAVGVVLATAAAIGMSLLAFRRQAQLALTPSASPGPLGRVGLARAVARLLNLTDPIAQATSDFILTTIARSRAQQAPIAINAAIGLGIITMALARRRADVDAAICAVPLVLTYWTVVGMRAAFCVPSELPAAWTFRMNAPSSSTSYAAGVRGAIVGLVAPPAVAVAIAVARPLSNWQSAAMHAGFVVLLIAALAEVTVLTIDFMPFTEPYRPGHAKLRTRWPVYLIGSYVFGFGLGAVEHAAIEAHMLVMLISVGAIGVVAAGQLGRQRARQWTVAAARAAQDGDDDVAVLNIGFVTTREQTPSTRV